MKKPTVSVVMATYNHAGFVTETIKSVLAQTGVDFEFLIADDGSSDSTRDVVANFHDERIRFFPSEVNKGACFVTNDLISKASGEFVALINSDDYWIGQDKLSLQVQFMRENPEIGACFGKAKFVDKEGKGIDKNTIPWGGVFDQPNRSQGAWLRHFFELGNCICHPTMLIRRSCFERLGSYNNRLRQLPDMDMWIRLVKNYPIHIFDKDLICFRVMPGENASSQTVTNSIRTINEHYLIAEHFFADVTSKQLQDGFSDVLKNKDIPSDIHLDIEKALLLMNYNQWLGKPYQMIGMLKLNELLNSPEHSRVMMEQYALDDRWFQKELGEIDVLRPKVVAVISQQKSRVLRVLQRVYARLGK
jgi:glycosyltransferase involved in cell wall biosynthesis